MSTFWIYALGLFAQALFAARMLVQWVLSEQRRKVVSPTVFWVLSLVASLLFFLYGWLRQDFALMLGQVIGYYVYIWNLGIKGVWKRLRGWRYVVVSALLLVPVVFMGSLAGDWKNAVATLFHNDAIPRWLLLFGSIGQVIFSLRFLYQYIYSSRRKESILSGGFWIISMAGALLILVYGIIRWDPVVILSQSFGLFTYIRNLILWRRHHHA